jgi:SAM-dependent methyltransferase
MDLLHLVGEPGGREPAGAPSRRRLDEATCPSCGGDCTEVFHEVEGVPTNSVLLLGSPDAATAVPQGDIRLAVCHSCGHIHNAAFDPDLTEYSGRYESTQTYSPTFNAFHERLAADTIERFGLRSKRIIEIGCGHGEFLTLLCELGGNRGLGLDPAHVPGRIPIPDGTQIEFVADVFGERHWDRQADFVVCKMTLEHIIDTGRFIGDLRRAIGDRPDVQVCFQVPNARYVLGERAFWDVYYEHCSYFTHGSLARLFRTSGFEVLDLWTDYDDQYLMIAARPATGPTDAALPAEDDLADVTAEVERFAAQVPRRLDGWRDGLRSLRAEGSRIVLWGGGSKAVAFLTSIGLADEIDAVVDINPRKSGTFTAGTGHPIIGPDALWAVEPDLVIVMNPVYLGEVVATVRDLGLRSIVRGVVA